TFQRLGIQIEQSNFNDATSMQKLKSGELSALVRVVGKPVDGLAQIPHNSGLHLISIPFSQKFADFYTLGVLSSQDYPALLPPGQQIDTIAVPAVLAVFNWQNKTDRYRRGGGVVCVHALCREKILNTPDPPLSRGT